MKAIQTIGIVTGAVFLLQLIFGDSFTLSLSIIPSLIVTEPWRLVTAIFAHGSFNHIFFNMFGLLMFGPMLEQRIGTKRFYIMYFTTGLIASVLSAWFYGTIVGSPNTSILGASGAIMGMLGVLIVLMPRLKLLFFFVIPMPLWFAGIVWFAIDTFGLFASNGIANIAHLGGLIAGLLFGFHFKKIKQKFQVRFAKKTSTQELNDIDMDEYMRNGRL